MNKKCERCGTNLKVKRITVNYWLRGGMLCENIGTETEDIEYCPKCDREPKDEIRYRSLRDSLF